MRLTVADTISPSYFVAIAAAQLGFFKAAQRLFPAEEASLIA